LATSAFAQTKPFGIASASKSGTNFPMVEDIRAVCSKPGAEITNVETNGTLDNIALVHGSPKAQFGIAQLDGLKYQEGIDKRMMERIQVVFPFFSTEIHLITKDGSTITDLSQLAGKRVIEGPEGSGTWVSVQVVKELTKLQWQGFYAKQDEGMKALLAGQADAMFIVAGKPVKIIEETPGARVISMKHPALDSFSLYTRAMIPAGTYPGTKTTVNTYKVDNAMITFAFKQERQAEIAGLVTCITSNLEKLQTGGMNTAVTPNRAFHPKWRDVDATDINRIQWPTHPAAKAAINRAAKKQ
jgi:TRAP transporter TAXI family solute receptor